MRATVGSSQSGVGGDIVLASGAAANDVATTGGSVMVSSGAVDTFSATSSSGEVAVVTANGAFRSSSGALTIATGSGAVDV